MGIDYRSHVNFEDLKNQQLLAIINTITVFKQDAAAGQLMEQIP